MRIWAQCGTINLVEWGRTFSRNGPTVFQVYVFNHLQNVPKNKVKNVIETCFFLWRISIICNIFCVFSKEFTIVILISPTDTEQIARVSRWTAHNNDCTVNLLNLRKNTRKRLFSWNKVSSEKINKRPRNIFCYRVKSKANIWASTPGYFYLFQLLRSGVFRSQIKRLVIEYVLGYAFVAVHIFSSTWERI